MVHFLKDWTGQIVIAVIIVTIFELILPNGNLKKYIKMVLGVYIIFCIISPFVNSNALYNFEDVKIENYIENTSVEDKTDVNQKSMDLRLQELYTQELEKDIEKRVNEYGYKILKCEINADLKVASDNPGIHEINLIISKNDKSIDKVEIGINNSQLNEEDEIIQELKKNISNYYEISEDIINIKIKD